MRLFKGLTLLNVRSIPSLDGLRAVAVCFVILGHTQSPYLDRIPFQHLFRNGFLGVNIFFVISGFLITHLLLIEISRYGDVDAKRFYIRRAFRIFPPFYAFLLVVICLHINHLYAFSWDSFLSAATYTWNYNPHVDSWILGHTWSLSLEEQFYLIWPACLIFFSSRTCLRIAGITILLSPFSRVATYFLVPALRTHMDMMLHTHIDTIMVGCFISLAIHLGLFTKLRSRLCHPASVAVSFVYLFFIGPYLQERYRGSFDLPIGITLTSFCCGAILIYAIHAPRSPLGRILNAAWVRHVGVISYGLYLWQQMFTGPETRRFPLNLLLIFLCAEASYWLVEKPANRLRDQLFKSKRVNLRNVDTTLCS
jgi:peptidoglycan/LPS O-acetylase OafA/YrhL